MRKAILKDERLRAVFDMLGEAHTLADIGCDHGHLSAALVTEGRVRRAVASDISPVSVEKARSLAERLGISDRMTAVEADGLELPFKLEKPYCVAMCGMGGELIAKLLEKSKSAALGASRIVMQPMRGEAELREYLYRNGYGITDERVILDDGRYYQIIAAVPNAGNHIPEGFPKDWFRFGWVMAERRGEELMPLLLHYRSVYGNELRKAREKGRAPGSLILEIERTDALIDLIRGKREEKPMHLKDFLEAMEIIAPRSLALEFDNPGLIVGTERERISRVLIALDCTNAVVDEAVESNCDLVLTHHPLLFRAVKRIAPDDPVTAPVYRLIRHGIGMFAAHTNLDSAEGGVNTELCRILGIENEEPVPPENLCRVGSFKKPVPFSEIIKRVNERLHTFCRAAGPEREIERVMVCGGSGGSEYPLAAECGAQLLITGECRHNEAIEAVHAGLNVIAAGHYETERIVLEPLKNRLEQLARGAEYVISSAEKNPLRI